MRGSVALSRISLCFLLFAGGVWSQTAPTEHASQQSPVEILVSISDNHNNTITPSRNDFQVVADYHPAQVQDLVLVKDQPLVFGVLLDISKSTANNLESAKQAAIQLFDSLAKGKNEGFLVLFNGRVAISKRALQTAEVQEALRPIRAEDGTAFYDAIAETCEQKLSRAAQPRSRRVIFAITDGEDNASHFSLAQVTQVAQREGVLVFALELISSSSGSRGRVVLRKLSNETGGKVINLKVPGEFLSKVTALLNQQYLLTFTPNAPADGKLHPLRVKVPKGVELSAPSQYLAR